MRKYKNNRWAFYCTGSDSTARIRGYIYIVIAQLEHQIIPRYSSHTPHQNYKKTHFDTSFDTPLKNSYSPTLQPNTKHQIHQTKSKQFPKQISLPKSTNQSHKSPKKSTKSSHNNPKKQFQYLPFYLHSILNITSSTIRTPLIQSNFIPQKTTTNPISTIPHKSHATTFQNSQLPRILYFYRSV